MAGVRNRQVILWFTLAFGLVWVIDISMKSKNGELQRRATLAAPTSVQTVVALTTVGNPSSSALASEDEPASHEARSVISEDGPQREPVTATSKGQPSRDEASPALRHRRNAQPEMPEVPEMPEIVCDRCPISVPTPGKMYVSDPTRTFLREIASEAAEVPYRDFTVAQLYVQAVQNAQARPVVNRPSNVRTAAEEPERVVTVPCDARDREFCSPPAVFRYPQARYPANTPLKFVGEITTPTGFVTHWRYALATEIRPCSAVERTAWQGESAYRVNPCDAKVGEDVALFAPFRVVESQR